MNTQLKDVELMAAKIIAEAQAKAAAMIKATKDSEVTYIRIRELEAKINYYNSEIKALRATLPNFSGTNASPRAAGQMPEGSPNAGVGEMVKGLIKQGYGNKEIVKIVSEHYGNTRTNYGCVTWYRNKMRKKGEL